MGYKIKNKNVFMKCLSEIKRYIKDIDKFELAIHNISESYPIITVGDELINLIIDFMSNGNNSLKEDLSWFIFEHNNDSFNMPITEYTKELGSVTYYISSDEEFYGYLTEGYKYFMEK
jgi:hypothetical protein